MNTLADVQPATTRLTPEDMRQVADWPEDRLESQLELRPEFVASIGRGNAELAAGQGQVVRR